MKLILKDNSEISIAMVSRRITFDETLQKFKSSVFFRIDRDILSKLDLSVLSNDNFSLCKVITDNNEEFVYTNYKFDCISELVHNGETFIDITALNIDNPRE